MASNASAAVDASDASSANQSNASAAVDASDASSANEGEDATETHVPPTNKHGGHRQMQSYGDKLACLEANNIKNFLKVNRCLCENDCLGKLYNKGTRGEQVVRQLREKRFAGKPANRF